MPASHLIAASSLAGIHRGDFRGEADGDLMGAGGDFVVSGGATNHVECQPSS